MRILCDDRWKSNELIDFCNDMKSFFDALSLIYKESYQKFLAYIFVDVNIINDLSNQFKNNIIQFPNIEMMEAWPIS